MNLYYSTSQVYLVFESVGTHNTGLSSVSADLAIDDIMLSEWSSCVDLDGETFPCIVLIRDVLNLHYSL